MEIQVVPAIIAKTQNELDAKLNMVIGKVKRVQLDIMDGAFVPNISLNFDFHLLSGLEYEAHLMVRNPLEWVDRNWEKIDIVILHVETLEDIGKAINLVKKKGLEVILALSPTTGLDNIVSHLKQVDGILVMTSKPGSHCIEFLHGPLEKIKELREIDRTIPIEVDGCEDPEHARLSRNAGANIFASGSYIYRSENVDESIREMEKAVRQ